MREARFRIAFDTDRLNIIGVRPGRGLPDLADVWMELLGRRLDGRAEAVVTLRSDLPVGVGAHEAILLEAVAGAGAGDGAALEIELLGWSGGSDGDALAAATAAWAAMAGVAAVNGKTRKRGGRGDIGETAPGPLE